MITSPTAIPSVAKLALLATIFTTTACTTTSHPDISSQAKTAGRLYWRVYPKSDNTFYLIPRPELTTQFPNPEAMNNLPREQAEKMATALNSALQFSVEKTNEGGTLMIRVVPEPLLEDVLEICRQKPAQLFLESRCQKELAWSEKGYRPDIYLKFDACEAVALARALNVIYGKKDSPSDLCPQLPDHVAK